MCINLDKGRYGENTAFGNGQGRRQWRTGKTVEKNTPSFKVICGDPMTLAIKGMMRIYTYIYVCLGFIL